MNPGPLRRPAGFLVLAGTIALAACARVRPLEGGAPDETPPRLVRASPPDSTAGISRTARFELDFDEPVGSASVRTAVRFEPFVPVGEIAVRGSRVTITTAESLPPDTSIVLVIGKSLADSPQRGNRLRGEIRLVYATGSQLRGAAVRGRVTVKGLANSKAAVRYEAVPPDTAGGKRPRRDPVTSVDPEGLFHLDGLPPDRRFVLRAFLDEDGNLYPDANELVAVYPETLRLGPGEVRRGLSWNIIDPREPGEVSGVVVNESGRAGALAIALHNLTPPPRADTTRTPAAETLAVRADTLRPLARPVEPREKSPWGTAYARLEPRGFVARDWVVLYASPRGDYSVRVPPGRHVLIAFVDVRRDSVPGLYVRPDSSGLAWEPLVFGDTLQVPAGVKVRARTMQLRAP